MAEVGGSSEWADPKSLSKALERADSLDDSAALPRAIWRMWNYEFYNGDWRAGERLADRFVSIADRTGDPADALIGDRLTGATLHHLGNQMAARSHLERMLAAYEEPADQRHMYWFHHDQRVVARAMLARVLCLRGFADQARRTAEVGLEEALAREHTLSIRYALRWGMFPVALMTGDLAIVGRSLRMFNDASPTQSPFVRLVGQSMLGMLSFRRGELESGTALLSSALDTFFGLGWTMCFPDMLGMLAEGLAGHGRPEEAQATVGEALERTERGGARWYTAELLRIQGELLRQVDTSQSLAAAEASFFEAISVAHRQGALRWELRAAIGLARLMIERDRRVDAREILAPIHARFTEGFETMDLRAARALLDRLA